MRFQAITLPPISIFATNIVLITLISTKLMIGLDGASIPFTLHGEGYIYTLAQIIGTIEACVPRLSILLSALLLLINSSIISRLSTRNMLYGMRSLTASPLLIVVLGGLMGSYSALVISLLSLVVTTIMYLIFGNIGVGNRSRQMFYSGVLLGVVILIYPPVVFIALLMPFSIFLLQRTGREEFISIVGVLFAVGLYLYSYWLCGSSVWEPLVGLYKESIAHLFSGVKPLDTMQLCRIIPTALLLLLSLVGVPSLTTTKYRLLTQYKLILSWLVILASIVIIILGGQLAPLIAICAAPIALVANRALVELNRGLSSTLYIIALSLFALIQLLF